MKADEKRIREEIETAILQMDRSGLEKLCLFIAGLQAGKPEDKKEEGKNPVDSGR